MLTSAPGAVGFAQPGFVQPGFVQPGLGASGAYGGVPIGTTNQFNTQGYNQGLFGCNSCPWWVWLLLGLLLIGSVIGFLASFFGCDEKKERRRHRKHRREVREEEENGKGSHLRMYFA